MRYPERIDARAAFGKCSCEEEIDFYTDDYEKYFFDQAPFNKEILDPVSYLIVGRRGSGKTSLTQYLNFQDTILDSLHIDVDEPSAYEDVLTQVADSGAQDFEVALKRVVKIWELLIWSLIFDRLGIEPSHASLILSEKEVFVEKTAAKKIKIILERLNRMSPERYESLPFDVTEQMESEEFKIMRARALSVSEDTPLLISIDSLERYSVRNEGMMRATAALIEAACNFNTKFSSVGIHVKIFISDEIYPFLSETAISNTLKYIKDPVFLRWRPKDVIRLIAFRYYLFLSKRDFQVPPMSDGDWQDFKVIRDKIWYPFFGRRIINRKGIEENSFAYVLRHTQMRPRQMIEICNSMARISIGRREFPQFHPETLRSAIEQREKHLASEVVNSYTKVYENVGSIVDALHGLPIMLLGKALDKVAQRTASQWPSGEYSPYKFRQLVAELGIVGSVRKHNEETGIVEADFEYNEDDRLPLQTDQLCVFHPMFVRKLAIKNPRSLIVYPFPDHPDFESMAG